MMKALWMMIILKNNDIASYNSDERSDLFTIFNSDSNELSNEKTSSSGSLTFSKLLDKVISTSEMNVSVISVSPTSI